MQYNSLVFINIFRSLDTYLNICRRLTVISGFLIVILFLFDYKQIYYLPSQKLFAWMVFGQITVRVKNTL